MAGDLGARLVLLAWVLVSAHVQNVEGYDWYLKMQFHSGGLSGTTNRVWGKIIGSRTTCEETLLKVGSIPNRGYLLSKTISCTADIGRIDQFVVRTDGNDGADVMRIELKNAVIEYILLEQTPYVSLRLGKGNIIFKAVDIDMETKYEKVTDGNIGNLVVPPKSVFGSVECSVQCTRSVLCEAYLTRLSGECELRRYKDGSSQGTTTYYRLNYLKRTSVEPV